MKGIYYTISENEGSCPWEKSGYDELLKNFTIDDNDTECKEYGIQYTWDFSFDEVEGFKMAYKDAIAAESFKFDYVYHFNNEYKYKFLDI
jgi:hypothetical protein